MNHKPMKSEELVPTWIFSAFYQHYGKSGKWSEEKSALAQSMTKSLKEKAKMYDWPQEVIDKVFAVNKYDDCNMYGISPKK